MNRSQFTFYRSFWDAVKPLPRDIQTEMIMALCAYALDEAEPEELSPTASALFALIRPTLDAAARMAAGGRARSKKAQHAEGKKPAKKKAAEKKLPRSQYGWVKLTDTEYKRLCDDLGDEAEKWISLVDEMAQGTGNKNGWKDWNLVVRRAARERWGERSAAPARSTAEARNAQIQRHGEALSPLAQHAVEAMLAEEEEE